ncbi:MAG: 50S ribosomal protein L6 [Candidatus Heimdallarchaeota archaeon LC_2]|nr:MAG: 50S ribosomal protein L6 [Candidatus Heimdallarchaeota archaeon LC_2]
MKIGRLQKTIEIPDNITIKIDNSKVFVKGNLGEIERDFTHSGIQIEHVNSELILSTYFPRKKEKSSIGTVGAHIGNMIEGTTYGYKYSLKIVFSHFPIRINPEMKKLQVKIENLYGGRKPRYAKILPGVSVKVDDEDVIVQGIDKEAVGQTAANIQELTRQRGKRRQSPKTFMDGVFLYHKANQITPE